MSKGCFGQAATLLAEAQDKRLCPVCRLPVGRQDRQVRLLRGEDMEFLSRELRGFCIEWLL